MTFAIFFSSIGVVIFGTIGALIILVAWSRERSVVSRSKGRSAEVMQGLVGPEQTADLLDIESNEDAKLTKAMTALVESLADTNQAVIQIGSVLLIKDSGKVITRSLSPRELRYLERHPRLLESPSVILPALSDPTTPLGRHSEKSLRRKDPRPPHPPHLQHPQ